MEYPKLYMNSKKFWCRERYYVSPTAKILVDPSVHGGEVFEVARLRRLNPRGILDFSSNINPLGPPSAAMRFMTRARWMVPYYPDVSYRVFRKAAADYAGAPTFENIVEGNGSTELIYLFAELFVRKGDRVLIPIPTFGEYERAVRNRAGLPIYLACKRDFTGRFADALEKGCKTVFLSSPNNPSSKTITKSCLFKLLDLASARNVRVFLDETFIEFTEDGDLGLSGRIEEFPNLVIARSLTKTFALTGLRIGYGLGARRLTERLRRAKMPWSVNILAQQAAIAAFRDRSYLERSRKLIAREREFLYSELRKIQGLTPFRPEANFILSRITRQLTAKVLKELLLDNSILIRDCSSFRGLDESYFRISVRLHEQNRRLLSSLRQVFD